MNDHNSDDTQPHSTTHKIEIDPKLGDSLQTGLDAIQKIFSGVVQSIKDAVGPETLKNLEVANWLEQFASCLDQIAASLNRSGTVPSDKRGELAFFIDQLDTTLAGSKFAAQAAVFQRRVEAIQTELQSVSAESAATVSNKLVETAGYFRAAAKTASPLQSDLGPKN